jgi:hypothetical protein
MPVHLGPEGLSVLGICTVIYGNNFLALENYLGVVATDIDSLKEQAQNLNKFPSVKEARWLESMMESSLIALDNHIRELEKLGYKGSMPNTLYKR